MAMRDETSEVVVSAATIWEIAIKRAIAKLRFDRPIVAAVLALGFEIMPVAGAHAERAGSLPPHHNDPFDRLITTQAFLEGLVPANAALRSSDARSRLTDGRDGYQHTALQAVISARSAPAVLRPAGISASRAQHWKERGR
jgi:PIN domain nuclease of toxin-antitoxin system